jgi:hypothetical protein
MSQFFIFDLPASPNHNDWDSMLDELLCWCRSRCNDGDYYVKLAVVARRPWGIAVVYQVGIVDRSVAMLFKLTYG